MQNGGIGSWMKLMGFDKAKKHKTKEKQNASQILPDNRYIEIKMLSKNFLLIFSLLLLGKLIS